MTLVGVLRAKFYLFIILLALPFCFFIMFKFFTERFGNNIPLDLMSQERNVGISEQCACEKNDENSLSTEDILEASKPVREYHAPPSSALRKIDPKNMPPEMLPDWDAESEEEPVERLPKALILGYGKCGTSALVTFLPLHPDIVTLDWEISYFCDMHYFHYDITWYKMRMPKSLSNQITIEKSPCYIEEVPSSVVRMYAFNSTLKVLITVRNPLDKILSHYGQRTTGTFPQNFTLNQFLTNEDGTLRTNLILSMIDYASKVKKVYSVFPKEQILIIDGDQLIENPLAELSRIESFLGIQQFFSEKDVYYDKEKGFYCTRIRSTGETHCLGAAKGREHAVMEPELKEEILKLAKPLNEEFFKLVERRFDWD